MNRKRDNRMFFNLTAVIVFLFTVLLSCIDAFAAKPAVRAYDDTDTEIVFNESNYALNAGNVTFVLDRDALLPGEFYVYEDGGVLTTVKDHTYVMEAGEDGEIKFVNFYKKKGDALVSVSECPFFVEFADAIKLLPDVTYAEGTSERPPSLTVGTRPWVQTFLSIDDGEKKTERHITGKTQVNFTDDGVYRVSVYTMDGKGNRTYGKKIPESIVVDKKPPVITELDTGEESMDEGGRIFGKKVTLSAKAWDERSGIEGIYWVLNGDETKADNVVVRAPFRGSVQVYARDTMGNTSERLDYFNELVVDDEEPDIKITQKTQDDGILKVTVAASDPLSGVEKIVTKLDGKVISEKKGSKDEVSIDLRGADRTEKKLVIYATDRAKNTGEGSMLIQKGDSRAPVIEILGVSDRGVYGNDVDVLIEASDDSGSLSSYSANILVKDAKGRMIYSRTTEEKRLRITQSGLVKITVTASDPDGNTASSAVSFIVDRDAPVINGLEKYDGEIFEDFFLDEKPEDMIEDLSSVTYDVYLNGLLYDGREVIKSGNYVLKVTATDEFGRRSEKKADFTVKREGDEETQKEEKEKDLPSDEASEQGISRNAAHPEKKEAKKKPEKTVSKGSVSKDRVSKKAVSEDRTLSRNQAQAKETPKEGFFVRLCRDILKLFGNPSLT